MVTRPASAKLASGRYTVYGEIASGGMATIQYGRLIGSAGFTRAVAIKQLHPQFAKDENFVSMLLDEARLSARIAHVNVAQTIDVLSEPGELSLIMEYVHGESLARLLDRIRQSGGSVPVRIAVSLVAGTLHGLHAAHETRGEHGEPLHIVHRDVSPENILVASDGIARLIDFGVARAQGRSRITPAGELKGKLAYMACEQYRGEEADRRVDVYGASVVLWETLTGRELFQGESDAAVVGAVMNDDVKPPSTYASEVSPELDAIVMRGIARDPAQRFATAREMALTLERTVGLASQSEVSDWLEEVAGELLAQRAETLRSMRMAADAKASSETREDPVTRKLEPSAERRESTPSGYRPSATPVPSSNAEDIAELPTDAALPVSPSSRPNLRVSSVFATRSVQQRAIPLLGLGLLLIALVWGVWLVMRKGDEKHQIVDHLPPPVPSVDPPKQEPPAEPTPVVEPAKSTLEKTPGPAAPTSARKRSPSPAARPSGSASDSKVDAKQRENTAKERATSKPKSRDAVDCTQPFWLDERGIRHVRRECL